MIPPNSQSSSNDFERPGAGELLYECEAADRTLIRCELFDHGPSGSEVRVFSYGELMMTHRFCGRSPAERWARTLQRDLQQKD